MLKTTDVTLQINLSPGDIAYAHLTVPMLVNAHRYQVNDTIAIVDCCRPQKTKIVDPERRFPHLIFQQKVEQICAIAEDLKIQGYLNKIVYLTPDHPLFPHLSKKYLNNWVKETHDYGGCALMSYLAGLEVPNSRYILHYDADMLLYQAQDYNWVADAIASIANEQYALAASPRISPPFAETKNLLDAPSLHEGRPLFEVESGWRNDWFSTRCFLVDKEKLGTYLPLIQGRLLLETLAIKYFNRGYPRSPEIMLFKRIGSAGGWRLNLNSEQSWLLHPATKPSHYIELLPRIINAVQQGIVPNSQRGYADIDLPAWEKLFSEHN